jgi:hypothetical protein
MNSWLQTYVVYIDGDQQLLTAVYSRPSLSLFLVLQKFHHSYIHISNQHRFNRHIRLTFPEFLRFLAYYPMPSFYADQLKLREKSPNYGKRLIRNIWASRTPYYERWLFESCLIRISEWEIAHTVELLRQ